MATAVASFSGSVVKRGVDVIEAALGTSTNASPWVFELLPTSSARHGHLLYAVGFLGSRPQDDLDKQRGGVGSFLNARSRIGVRVQHYLREASQPADYRTALSINDIIVATLIDAADGIGAGAGDGLGPQKWHWIETRPPRAVADGQFLLSEIHFWVDHVPSINL